MSRKTVGTFITCIVALAATSTAQAAQTAGGCRAAKLKAASAVGMGKLKCYAAYFKHLDVGEFAACNADRETKFGVDFVRIESRGGCSTSGDSAEYLSKIDDFVLDIMGEGPCPGKAKVTGSELQKLLKCYGKAVKKAVPVDADCLDKAEAMLIQKFDKADEKGCMPTGGAAAIQAHVDAAIAAFFPPQPIRLFSAGPQSSALLGNRATTTGKCSTAATAQGLSCSSIVALLSYTGDQVSDFPTSVTLPTNVAILAGSQTIANDWADFLDGTWNTCLGAVCSPAGPTGANLLSGQAWTGTKADGTLGNNCQDWTSTDGSFGGRSHLSLCYGVEDSFSCQAGGALSYVAESSTACSVTSSALLCLCY